MAIRDHFRSIARRPVSLRASVTTDTGEVGVSAQVIDLGLGGACLQVSEPFTQGQRVCIQLEAANLWNPLLVYGLVAWQRSISGGASTRVGIRFEHQSGATLLALVDLIASSESAGQ
jgi:hypothetical protein